MARSLSVLAGQHTRRRFQTGENAMAHLNHYGPAASLWQKALTVAALVAALAAGTLVASNGVAAGTDPVAGGLPPVVIDGGDLGPATHFAPARGGKMPGWPGENV